MNDAATHCAHSLVALHGALARLDGLLEREILRLRARYELSLDEFRGLYISDQQVDELLGARSDGDDVRSNPAREDPAEGTPLKRLVDAYSLDADAADIVLLALAPDIDPKYEVLFAYLNNDVTRKLPTGELVTRVFGCTREHRLALRGALAPDATLIANGIVEFAAGSARCLGCSAACGCRRCCRTGLSDYRGRTSGSPIS